ncbi:MAG TPA: tyrosine-type recombinase/integrase [Acidimicrobiales bacterium]|nr:tyrosine-type recombinase/integrase [Acidimicrobiales bacterium]
MPSRHGFPDQEIGEPIAQIVWLRPDDLPALTDAWLAEYSNPRTQERYSFSVLTIARSLRATTPEDLSPAAIAGWAQSYQGANNTIRGHLTAIRGFLRWCHETGQLPDYRDRPYQRLLKSYPPTYGKVQAPHAANRLDETGYHALLGACTDGTEAGLRDELLVRLGVSGGMRVSELLHLTVGALRRAPSLGWPGKARKMRTATAGPALTDLIRRYLAAYATGLDRPLSDDDPIFCKSVHAKHPGVLRWGDGIGTNAGLRVLLLRRANTAGLGYMAPHDLKRSAARMMHEARSADGGHLFDLLDIADVLDHSNPKVTKDCYIGPLGNGNKDRAAALFG